MISVVHDGVKLNCRASGLSDGNDVALLIHGLNTNMAFWHPLLVRRLGQQCRLITYDQRGHGYSGLPPSGYTSADLAGDARAILDALEVDRADVVAHSFGAAVALQLVRLYPERVRSLVVLDGHLRLLQPELRLRDWSQFDRWQRHFAEEGISLAPDLPLDFEFPLHIEGAAWAKARDGLAADGFFVPSSGKRAATKYRKLIAETTAPEDFRKNAGLSLESLRCITQPTIAVYGSISPYLPTRDGLLREIPGCQTETIAGAGHNGPFLMPEKTADAIKRFWLVCPSGRVVS